MANDTRSAIRKRGQAAGRNFACQASCARFRQPAGHLAILRDLTGPDERFARAWTGIILAYPAPDARALEPPRRDLTNNFSRPRRQHASIRRGPPKQEHYGVRRLHAGFAIINHKQRASPKRPSGNRRNLGLIGLSHSEFRSSRGRPETNPGARLHSAFPPAVDKKLRNGLPEPGGSPGTKPLVTGRRSWPASSGLRPIHRRFGGAVEPVRRDAIRLAHPVAQWE